MSRYTVTHKGTDIPIAYPGVTTITGLLDKSTPLMIWATGMMLKWLHKNWIDYVTEEAKTGNWIEFEEREDYFRMLDDAKEHYKEVSDDARIVGNCVHDLTHHFIKSDLENKTFNFTKLFEIVIKENKLPENLNSVVESRFNNTKEWLKENVSKFYETEQPICSKKYGHCGTFDILAELKSCLDKDNFIKGGLYIVDLKSSKDFYNGQGKQTAGYKIGREEGGDFNLKFKDDTDKENIIEWEKDISLKPIKIDGIGILTTNFKDKGIVKFKDYTNDMEIKEKSFLNLLKFYYGDKNRRLKNNPFILKAKIN
jgi:hypothetical protein